MRGEIAPALYPKTTRVSQVVKRGTTASGFPALASLYSWFTEGSRRPT
jgi:hypothetical protein